MPELVRTFMKNSSSNFQTIPMAVKRYRTIISRIVLAGPTTGSLQIGPNKLNFLNANIYC